MGSITGRTCCGCVYGVGLFVTTLRRYGYVCRRYAILWRGLQMNIKTPYQARKIKERAKQTAIEETKRLQQRRLDADERKFLNEFKEVWE